MADLRSMAASKSKTQVIWILGCSTFLLAVVVYHLRKQNSGLRAWNYLQNEMIVSQQKKIDMLNSLSFDSPPPIKKQSEKLASAQQSS
ncbi:MAG: hypothetical protein H7068_04240 [Pedobacter sp.]|nr:hypothetical protein [Chitinophagaceae bacterium]